MDYGGVRNGNGFHYYANGDIYDGEFVNNKRVGKSRLRLHDGSEYIGQFIDNEIDGHGIYTDKFGNRYMSIAGSETLHRKSSLKFLDKNDTESGHFYKLKLYGKGEIKFKNGNTYIGQFKAGKRDGEGEMIYMVAPDINKHEVGDYIGSWKRDKRDGRGIMNYINGSYFEGQWKNDQKFNGTLKLADNTTYKGRFYNNKYHGQGMLVLHNGVTIEGEFVNGELKDKGKLIKQTADGFGKKYLKCLTFT